MKYRVLGKTGLNVSVIGVGTWQYGGEWGKDFTMDEVRDILDVSAEFGINLIDTAECYGEHLSESLIGQALAGKRGQWIIATKFGHQFHGFLNRSDRRTAARDQATGGFAPSITHRLHRPVPIPLPLRQRV